MAQEPDWTRLLQFAEHLAHAAAAEIMPHFRKEIPVDVKADVVWDPVTEADRAGERAMRALIEAHYPEHGIHGEEYGEKPSRSGFTWILDPVDGTRSFLCGMPTWATLIGLNFEGSPGIGVMNQPHTGEMFTGAPGRTLLKHRGTTQVLKVRPPRPLAQCTLTTTAPELYRTPAEKAVLASLSAATRLTRYGGDAYFFCMLAAGQVDIAMDARMQPYDIAPLLPIVRGAGGVAARWDGGDPAQGGDVVTASAPQLLEEALAIIRNATPQGGERA